MKKIVFGIMGLMLAVGLFLIGCSSVQPAVTIQEDENTAKVYFVRGGGVDFQASGSIGGIPVPRGIRIALLNDGNFLSEIGRNEYLVYNFKEGTHYFTGFGFDWYFAEVELAAGNTYFIEIYTRPDPFNNTNVLMRTYDLGETRLKRDFKEISPKGKMKSSRLEEGREKLEAAKNGFYSVSKITLD